MIHKFIITKTLSCKQNSDLLHTFTNTQSILEQTNSVFQKHAWICRA